MIKTIKRDLLLILLLATGCSGNITATLEPTVTPQPAKDLPQITSVVLDRTELPRYGSLEITLSANAQYTNPYHARQVNLDGIFTGPSGKEMAVPGFWTGPNPGGCASPHPRSANGTTD